MAATLHDVLNEKIEEFVLRTSESLESGKCGDYAEYRYLCGQIRGLKVAQTAITDLMRKMQEDDDDE